MAFLTVVSLVLHLTSILAVSAVDDCATNRNSVVKALFMSDKNLDKLDSVFYPAGELPSRFIQVNYHINDTSDGNCNVSYFWASGEFLLLQPPKIFLFTSLLFSYPANNLTSVNLTLPPECKELVTVSEDGSCACPDEDSLLNRLTQQVGTPYIYSLKPCGTIGL